MQTSNFASHKKKNYKNPVAICAQIPNWFDGRSCYELSPSWELIHNKDSIDLFENKFMEYLDSLNVKKIIDYLKSDATLLCYEKKDAFCHRHIVAKWLRKNGIEIEEDE